MIDVGEVVAGGGTSGGSLKDSVFQHLSAEEKLCEEFVKFLREKIEESFSIFRLTGIGLFGEKEIKFSAKQAYGWLSPEFSNYDLPWCEDHVPYVLQYLWDKRFIDLKEHDPDFVSISDNTEFIFSSPIQSEIRNLLISNNTDRVGIAMAQEGKEAKYPVIIIPGLGSSALSVWESEYRPDWVGERLWLDFSKVGTEIKLPSLWKSPEKTQGDYGMFVRHMLLADDGHSDPPGVRVRPMEGLEAVASLSPVNRLTTGITTIFGELIKNLLDVGYDRRHIAAAPYDWRLPIQMLEERDNYFTQLKSQVENLFKANHGKRVVFICHSNGNRVAHYFTHWAEKKEPGWCKNHIHGFIALAAPYLGAPKMARAIVTGDALGLDIVLVEKAQEAWGRHMGSYPALLPLQEHLLPSRVLMLYTGDDDTNEETTDSPHVLSHKQRFHPSPELRWKHYQNDEQYAIPEEESAAFTEITARVLSGVWLIDYSLCKPSIPENSEDYLPNLSGWARDLILKLLLFMDSPKQNISTAKNGYKETNEMPEGTTKSVAYPFDHKRKIKSVNVTRTSNLTINGKQIVTTYYFPKQYVLEVIIALTEEANTMRKRIIISKNDTVIEEYVRYFRRETPFSLVQQCLDEHESTKIGNYSSPGWRDFISRVIPTSYQHYDRFFVRDEFIFGAGNVAAIHNELTEESVKEYPILNPPVGVDNLWCIYGRDKDTEITYYLSKKMEDHSICYHLDADQHSLTENANNPSGISIKEGIGFETSTTSQPCLKGEAASGDGTVPYYSLSYCKNWKNSKDVNVDIIEVAGQEHTDMLKNDQVIYHVLKYLCDGENPYSS